MNAAAAWLAQQQKGAAGVSRIACFHTCHRVSVGDCRWTLWGRAKPADSVKVSSLSCNPIWAVLKGQDSSVCVLQAKLWASVILTSLDQSPVHDNQNEELLEATLGQSCLWLLCMHVDSFGSNTRVQHLNSFTSHPYQLWRAHRTTICQSEVRQNVVSALSYIR